MKNCFSALLLTLCLGCASAIVRPYVGEQQSWPTATGSIVNMKYDVPIFTSLPPTPYEVLAELRIESALYAQPQEGHLPLVTPVGGRVADGEGSHAGWRARSEGLAAGGFSRAHDDEVV